jgi:hypothetical protein
MARVIRLLTLIAVLLMPLEMAPAAAAAHEAPAMAMQHCPDQPSGHAAKGFGECMMACSAALPAADVPRNETTALICLAPEAPPARELSTLHPDIATPPPRRS